MRQADTTGSQGEPCRYVLKHGIATRKTIGRVGLFSCVREYFSNQTHRDSTEWAILPYDYAYNHGEFANSGDSGSMIVSPTGEYGGLLTGGSGRTPDLPDLTYATPMFWLWPVIKAQFPNASLESLSE